MSTVNLKKEPEDKDIPDVTILVQGPLHPNSVSNIFHYLRFGNVVISAWKDQSRILDDKGRLFNQNKSFKKLVDDFLDFYTPEKANSISFVFLENLNKKQLHDKGFYNHSNCYFQYYSTIKGLDVVDTKYCIKVRSDEFYTDLQPIIDKVRDSDRKKIVTTNTFFRKSTTYPWHPSDHVVAGTTENMKKVFAGCVEFCENGGFFKPEHALRFLSEGQEKFEFDRLRKGKEIRYGGPEASHAPVPETIMGAFNILLNSDIDLDTSKHSKIMQDFFDVVSVEKLGWFIISQGILKRHRLFRDYDPSMWSFAERKMSVLNSMSEMTNEDVRLNLDV